MLTALIDGPVLHAALGGMTGIDDAWIAQLVRVVLEGALPPAAVDRPAPSTRRKAPSRSRTRPNLSEVTHP